MVRLLRLPAVKNVTGLGDTSIYARVKDGLFTPPIKLTQRASAWPENEVDEINRALIRGANKDELRTLVRQLVQARHSNSRSAAGVAASA